MDFKLSPSKIDTFSDCPRLFYYRYIKKPIPEPPKKAFVIGNAVHMTLELFHSGKDLSSKAMSAAFKTAYNRYKNEKPVLNRDDWFEIKDMIKKYLKYGPKDGKVLSIEQFFSINFEGLVTINGKADRLDRDDKNNLYIVDYKTSKSVYTKKEIEKSSQLPIYAYWAKHHFGIFEDFVPKNIYGVFVFVRHLDTKKGIKKVLITDFDFDKIKERVERMISCMKMGEKSGSKAFEPNEAFKWCGYCPYRLYCLQDRW